MKPINVKLKSNIEKRKKVLEILKQNGLGVQEQMLLESLCSIVIENTLNLEKYEKFRHI